MMNYQDSNWSNIKREIYSYKKLIRKMRKNVEKEGVKNEKISSEKINSNK